MWTESSHRLWTTGILLVAIALPAGAREPASVEERARALVLVHHFEGIPYLEARSLGAAAIPTLVEILEEPSLSLFWVNAIVTLGFIEDPAAYDPLVAFYERRTGEVDDATYRALGAVPYAMGCLAAGGSDEALDFLETLALGQRALDFSWRSRDPTAGMAHKAILALGISGRTEALRILDRMEEEAASARSLTDREAFATARNFFARIRLEGRESLLDPGRRHRSSP